MKKVFTIKTVVGYQIEPYINDLANLRCSVFQEYPFLYVGDEKYEQWYLGHYAKQKNSMLVLVLDENQQVVGCSSGMPMEDEKHYQIIEPFVEKGYEIQKIFLYGESILLKSFRGLGIGNIFFSEREKFVRSFDDRFSYLSFFVVERPVQDPKRPQNFWDMYEFWAKKGFEKTNLSMMFPYQEIGEKKASNKLMRFWLKNLSH